MDFQTKFLIGVVDAKTWADLSELELRVLGPLLKYANTRTGAAFPKLATIAAEAGLGRSNASMGLKRLRERGLLTDKCRGGRGRQERQLTVRATRMVESPNRPCNTDGYRPCNTDGSAGDTSIYEILPVEGVRAAPDQPANPDPQSRSLVDRADAGWQKLWTKKYGVPMLPLGRKDRERLARMVAHVNGDMRKLERAVKNYLRDDRDEWARQKKHPLWLLANNFESFLAAEVPDPDAEADPTGFKPMDEARRANAMRILEGVCLPEQAV